MQITEKLADGLKREIQVVLAATELAERRDKRIDEIKDRVQLKGFRKGKVPPTHLKKVFGRSIMAEIVQEAVQETSKQALDQREERPAMQPTIDLTEDEKEIEEIISGNADLSFKMAYEVLPDLQIVDLSTIELEKLVAEVPEKEIDDAVANLAAQNKSYEAQDGRVAEPGDRLTIDFIGRIDGEAFDGGTAEGVTLVLGDGQFIPGFEEGLTGAKAGDKKDVTATFPDDYPAEPLKGKTAIFETTVQEVAVPREVTIDDAFAETLGAENLEKLREAIKGQIAGNYARMSRAAMKRTLLDKLDELHTFELPPTLVDTEFNGIWQGMQKELEQSGTTLEDEG